VGIRFPFIRPTLPAPEEWLPFLQPSYEAGWFSNWGPTLRELEDEIAQRFGRPCVGVANGTLGLTAALLALGVRGRVVLPSFTFPATACAIALAGCEPVFCDVDEETWELDTGAAEAMVKAGAAAVVHVRSFGLCRDLGEIEAICSEAGIPLVVDAAAALGGTTASGPVGGAGRCEVFSLHATKPFAIGEGGLVFGDEDLVSEVRRVSNFGLSDGDVVRRGLNAKMDEFSAARGRAMLRRLDAEIAGRAGHAAAYRESLDPDLVTHPFGPGAPPWQTYPVRVRAAGAQRRAIDELARRGVHARAYYAPALHESSAFRSPVQLPVSERLSRSMVCLPTYGDASAAELEELTGLAAESLEAAART
jgi:dTDP-4-amino-4,6-dideoxygalactose transaminase